MATTNTPDLGLETLFEDADHRRFQAALARIERGTFGLCIDCDRPIERARLDQMPLAEQCARCSRVQEAQASDRRLD